MEANDRYIVTDSRVRVFRDWKDAVRGIDVDLPAIRMKADPERASPKDIFQRGKARGLCKVCSTHSEDALTWILFRSLDRTKRLMDFLAAWFPRWPELGSAVLRHTLYWGRKPEEWEIDPPVVRALRQLEPYHAAAGRQHTETDFAAALSGMRVQVESKLGTGTGSKSGWEKSKGKIRPEYRSHVEHILKQEHWSEWEDHMLRLYQPLRQLALATLLEGGDLRRVGLLLLVNEPLGPREDAAHRVAFRELTTIAAVPETQISMISWKQVLRWLVETGDARLSEVVAALSENPLTQRPRR